MTLQNFDRYEDLAQNHLKRVKTKKDKKIVKKVQKSVIKLSLTYKLLQKEKFLSHYFTQNATFFPKTHEIRENM